MARVQLPGFLGLGLRADDAGYVPDEQAGVMNASRKPDRWVRTTCGYCSVGCGMLLGVRDNRAVSVMGDPDHPVNEGRLCPKGLSEHHTLAAEGRLTAPRVRRRPGGSQEPATGDDAPEARRPLAPPRLPPPVATAALPHHVAAAMLGVAPTVDLHAQAKVPGTRRLSVSAHERSKNLPAVAKRTTVT